jgi:crotonobetainyl-CoA:carnitine CoA-transferase CaiB-like acyl-CoA transferase
MLPLQDIRVIEFCNVAAGPYCGMLLADMGADLIKVEHPQGGDSMRQWPPLTDGYSENFASLNRNKRSVALDLKKPGDRDRARRLVLDADVLIENNRPGVMERLGLGYASLAAGNPKLVYCSISAFGQEGPRAEEGGFDLTLQAMAGVMSVTGEPGGAPVKCGVPLSDFCAGLYGAFAGTSPRAWSSPARSRSPRRCARSRAPAAARTSTSPCSAPRSRWRRSRPANTSAPGAIR